MTLSQLECFLVLSELQNFTKASEALFITQPAFSRRISTLEIELGVKLFDRGNRDVKLTEAGKIYKTYVLKCLDLLDEGASNAKKAEAGMLGCIRLGILRDGREDILMNALKKYQKEYPQVEVKVLPMHHAGLEKALLTDDIDIGFFNSQSDELVSKSCTLVLEESPQCIVVNNTHRFSERKSISVSELKEEKFVLLDYKISPYCEKLMKLCGTSHFKPNVVQYCELVTEMLNVIESGVGIGFCSKRIAKIASPELKFIKVEEGELIQHLAVWKYENNNQWLPGFINMLEKEIRKE